MSSLDVQALRSWNTTYHEGWTYLIRQPKGHLDERQAEALL